MPKRRAQSKIESYQNKIRKIQEKENRRRRIIPPLTSSSEDEGHAEDEPAPVITPEPAPDVSDLTLETDLLPNEPTAVPDAGSEELNPELLTALGEFTSDVPEYGENLHDNLSKLWLPLLKKGMPNETKDKVLKEYLVPDNSRLLQSPKLNPEISSAIPDMVRDRDKKLIESQQQLGLGITAINRGIDILLRSDNKAQAMRHLSNGCRLLCDSHSMMTQNRVKLITPSLDKSFLHVINETERDETFFGASLSDKIKTAKAIEKQGLQIKNQKPPVKAHFYNCWLKITNNSVVLDWIKNGFTIPFEKYVSQSNIPQNSFSATEKIEMAEAINNLIELGAISACKLTKNQFISRVFLTTKSNGGKRFILNLKPLNKYVQKDHFKMEDYRTACKLISRNGYLATIDLKDLTF